MPRDTEYSRSFGASSEKPSQEDLPEQPKQIDHNMIMRLVANAHTGERIPFDSVQTFNRLPHGERERAIERVRNALPHLADYSARQSEIDGRLAQIVNSEQAIVIISASD